MSTVVKTQVELDAALAAGKADIIIDSPAGVWLTLDRGVVSGIRGSSCVGPISGSATVRGVSGSATVSDVWGSATVHLYDRASATRVGSHVAVFIDSLDATTDGGVVIRTVDVDKSNPVAWCALNAIPAIDGKAVLYKAVDGNLVAGRDHTPTAYPLGATVTAADWSSDAVCGRGLHFGRSPRAAHVYYSGDGPPRFLACEIDLSESVPLDDEIKARSCRVLHEVDRHGREITA